MPSLGRAKAQSELKRRQHRKQIFHSAPEQVGDLDTPMDDQSAKLLENKDSQKAKKRKPRT